MWQETGRRVGLLARGRGIDYAALGLVGHDGHRNPSLLSLIDGVHADLAQLQLRQDLGRISAMRSEQGARRCRAGHWRH